jgi:hypothetical protein
MVSMGIRETHPDSHRHHFLTFPNHEEEVMRHDKHAGLCEIRRRVGPIQCTGCSLR